jgi:putative colanic acid biosynthesis acetyltransferase WcaF
VWLHNREQLTIGCDVAISQEALITTGSHNFRTDMGLNCRSVTVEDGAWITSRVVVLAGSLIEQSALILPNSVVHGRVPQGLIFGSPAAKVIGDRFAVQSSESAGEF